MNIADFETLCLIDFCSDGTDVRNCYLVLEIMELVWIYGLLVVF